MMRRTFWSVKPGVVLVILALAAAYHSDVGLAQQGTKMRWDIVKRITFRPNGINPGGVAFATAYDGSFIKLTGSGTFGPGKADPVTGGGTWETRPVFRGSGPRVTGKGKYTVTGLVSFHERMAKQSASTVDNIGNKEDATGGLVVLRIAYTNEDGSPAGTGVLIVSCRVAGKAGIDLFEGATASKGAVMYFNPAPSMPRVNANRTAFHRQAR